MLVRAEDVRPVKSGTYACLALLEKRAMVCRASPSVFVSLIRTNPTSSIVLDCRAREHVASGTFLPIVQRLAGITMAEYIPPHQQCDQATRENVKQWLQTNCNLKTVYVMDAYPAKQSLNGNNMLTRVLKYLGLSGAMPVRVNILDCGLHIMMQQKYPLAMIQLASPVKVALTANPRVSDGLYVMHQEYLKAKGMLDQVAKDLDIRHVINVTRLQTTHKGVKEMGHLLPFKDANACTLFYSEILSYFTQVPNGQNVLIIDTHLDKIASEIYVMLLILFGGYSYEVAVNLARDRLGCPEFDSSAKACFMLMSETQNQASLEQRITTALGQLGARFDPDHELKTTTALTVAERWRELQKSLDGKPGAMYQPTFDIVTKLFNNILMHPDDPKYRKIRLSNPRIAQAFHPMPNLGPNILLAGGWHITTQSDTFEYPQNKSLQPLRDMLIFISAASV